MDFVRLHVNAMRERGETVFHAPHPQGDKPYREKPVVGSNYSDEQLLKRGLAVFEGALEAYRQIVEEWFSALAPRLEIFVLMPVRITGGIHPARPDQFRPPLFEWWFEPLAEESDSVVDFQIGQREEFVAREEFFRSSANKISWLRPGTETWIAPTIHRCDSEVFGSDPIAVIAYKWLWEDLKKIHWVK